MKLGIGTAQFGLDYGISNKEGKISIEEAGKILDYALDNGIKVIDTAHLYGNSESILGKFLKGTHTFKIITKTPKFSDKINQKDAESLEKAFLSSLKNMNQQKIYGLLIHNADDLIKQNSEFLYERMIELKGRGLVDKIGVSIYNARQIDSITTKFELDIVQLPINVLDQRLFKSGHLKKLKDKNIEIHARSVFLQGILLMNPLELPEYFNPIKETITHYSNHIAEIGISPIQSALKFVLEIDEIEQLIIGICNKKQLKEIIEAVNSVPTYEFNYEPYSVKNEFLLNPAKWSF